MGTDQDLHAAQVDQENDLVADMLKGYDHDDDIHTIDAGEFLTMGGDYQEAKAAVEKEIWLDDGTLEHQNFDVNCSASSLFHNEDFPVLPDFPCMSSSSSSSSIPAPYKAQGLSSGSSSSSSAASRFVLKSEYQDAPGTESMDVMEDMGDMDLIDVSDLWDPSSIFEDEENIYMPQVQNQEVVEEDIGKHYDELGAMFFEWLKNNKNNISAEDMRSIKLKRSTVETALKRLGTTKEGKKQLLKLILEWVEQYQLQKKRKPNPVPQYNNPLQNPNPNLTANPVLVNPNNTTYPPPSWIPPYTDDPAAVLAAGSGPTQGPVLVPVPVQVPQGYYMGLAQPSEYQMMDSGRACWSNSQFVMGSQYNQYAENKNMNIVPETMNPHSTAFYGDQYPYHHHVQGENGERVLRLSSSATYKEARKIRMARQRKTNPLHHHHRRNRHHHRVSNNQNQNQEQYNQVVTDQDLRHGGEHCATNAGQSNSGAWVYVPCGSVPPPGVSTVRMIPPEIVAPPAAPPPASQKRTSVQNSQRQAAADRRQGWKQENNLKLLLQKVLKQSDVGNLGRIVLPKKEAETHFPPLETGDGISIPIEDIGTSCLWNMRYRFWPNNKSRMYILENTGEFVRANGLQEGDFIVIYSDMRCGKYLIRGVKVRQTGKKPESKKTVKKKQKTLAASGSQSSPAKPIEE